MGNPSNQARIRADKQLEHSKGGPVHASYGAPLPVESDYNFEHPDNGTGEPDRATQHNPFYMAAGMAVGYSKGLYGKGQRREPPARDDMRCERQWGDPKDEDDWYE